MRLTFTRRTRLVRQAVLGLVVAAVVAPDAGAFRTGHGASGEGVRDDVPTAGTVVRSAGAQAEADGFAAIYRDMLRPTTGHTAHTGSDPVPKAVAAPGEAPPTAMPDVAWDNAAIGIALGAIAGLVVAALLMGRRRGAFDGA